MVIGGQWIWELMDVGIYGFEGYRYVVSWIWGFMAKRVVDMENHRYGGLRTRGFMSIRDGVHGFGRSWTSRILGYVDTAVVDMEVMDRGVIDNGVMDFWRHRYGANGKGVINM